MGWLIIKEGINKGAKYKLGERNLTIGRDQGNLIQIIDDLVSRRHAMIKWENGKYRIIDLQSKNGTMVNNSNVHEKILSHKDLLKIGGSVLEFEDAPSSRYADDAILKGRLATAEMRNSETRTFDYEKESSSKDYIDADAEFLKRERIKMKFVYKLSSKIKKNAAISEIFSDILDGILSAVEPDRVILFLFKEKSTKLSPITMKTTDNLDNVLKRLPPDYNLIKNSINERKVLFIETKTDKISACASMPLLYRDIPPFGAIYIDFLADEFHPILEEDKFFLKTIANEAAFAIAREKGQK